MACVGRGLFGATNVARRRSTCCNRRSIGTPPRNSTNRSANSRSFKITSPISTKSPSSLKQLSDWSTSANSLSAAQNRHNLEARVIEVQTNALRRQGQVGDLKDAELYRAVQSRILGQLPSGDAPFDARLTTLLSSLYDAANSHKLAGVIADTRTFAFKTFPPLLARQVQQYENLVNDLCESACVKSAGRPTALPSSWTATKIARNG